MGRVFSLTLKGELKVHLDDGDRTVLQSLLEQMASVLSSSRGEPALARLAPPAYVEEPEHEEEYQRFMGDELHQRQLGAVRVMSESAFNKRLNEEEAQGWLSALNNLRLILGTQLDVSEDTDEFDLLDLEEDDLDPEDAEPPDPDDRVPALHLYRYLSMLLDDLVTALAEGLPDVPDADADAD